jgi:hypothetical protein
MLNLQSMAEFFIPAVSHFSQSSTPTALLSRTCTRLLAHYSFLDLFVRFRIMELR